MFCKNCGAIIEDGQKFCTSCGTPVTNGVNNEKVENDAVNQNAQSAQSAQKATSQPNVDVNDTVKETKEKIGNYSAGNDNIITTDGEEIVGEAKWSLVALLIPFILVFFVLIVYSNTNSYYYGFDGITVMKVLVWIVYIISLVLSVWLFLFRRKLVVTNKKIYARIGLIGIKQYTIPLDKINYLSVRYNIIDRIIGSANLVVCSGASLFPISFLFIRNAKELRALLEQQMESYKKTF